MTHDAEDFEQFMKAREQAARAYVQGDMAPLDGIVARVSPATFFGPKGGHRTGAEEVSETYAHDDQAFAPGGESHFEILHMGASDGIGYWVGFQLAKARMRGQAEPVPMKLRVTELFRREGNEWKLIHRHADTLAIPDSQASKSASNGHGEKSERGARPPAS